MTTKVEMAETFIVGGQALAADDFVKVKSGPGRKDGFIGVFRGIWMDEDGGITGIDVWGDKSAHHQRMRTFRPERIEILSTKMQNKLRRQRDLKMEGE